MTSSRTAGRDTATSDANPSPSRHDTSSPSHTPGRAARDGTTTRPRFSPTRAAEGIKPAETRNTDALRTEIARRIGIDALDRYFGRSTDLTIDENGLRVCAQSRFAADLIRERFGPDLSAALIATGLDAATPIIYTHRPANLARPIKPEHPTHSAADTSPSNVKAPARRRTHTDDSRTLDTFVVGRCNRLAYEATRRVAEDNAADGACPLFIYGPCGVGKSHLLAAAARRFSERYPHARVRILSAEAFTNEYIGSLRAGRVESFHRAYRKIDLLCIDDVHFLSKKSGTQNELLHTFDALDLRGSRVVLASDNHPRQIKAFSGALVSRFVSGSLAHIEPPDEDMRCRLIETFARRAGLSIDRHAAESLAAAAASQAHTESPTVRDLIGLLNRARAYLRLTAGESESRLTASVVAGVLRSAGPHDDHTGARPIPIDRIIDSVCSALGLTREDLSGRGRSKPTVLGRALIALLARRLTRRSYPEIAQAIGRPTHSTIIGAHKRINAQMERGETVAAGLHFDGIPIQSLAERLERELRIG